MRAKLIRIGNSKGVRLPKPILEASGIQDEVALTIESGRIVLARPDWRARERWAEDARRMVANGDDQDDEDWSDWESLEGEALEEDWAWPEDFNWPEEEIVSTYISPDSIPSEVPRSPRPVPASSSRRRR
jgi:antitoxin MazE